ncbi:MAG: hypothetical protein KJ808_09275 [Acidobacteria bacterium]|nr:hypothetical protein [Acidobacteriota bacterium]MBU4306678.1 hypothetical protein [Acidobacteriota bacterium]MCG2812737.1 hypothetical protein [Candidatus Aminicenantes bacterium]
MKKSEVLRENIEKNNEKHRFSLPELSIWPTQLIIFSGLWQLKTIKLKLRPPKKQQSKVPDCDFQACYMNWVYPAIKMKFFRLSLKSIPIPEIGSMSTCTIEVIFQFRFKNTYRVLAEADGENSVREFNENNNKRSTGVQCFNKI